MRSLIVYCSLRGTTRKAAEIVKENLIGDVEIVDLQYVTNLQITDGFETIIIGSSIHMGQIHKKIDLFIENNSDILFEKNIGLFICCLKSDLAHEQLNKYFSEELLSHANSNAIFDGELIFSKMNMIEKLIVKFLIRHNDDKYELNEQKVKEFANKMNTNTSKRGDAYIKVSPL